MDDASPNTETPTVAAGTAVSEDHVLQILAATANASKEFGLGITLTVAGAIVSGLLIGRDNWMTEVEEHYEPLRFLTGPIREMNVPTEPNPLDELPENYGFIHLKDARYLTGGGHAPGPDSEGMYWRGRISEVSGWSYGTLGPTKD